MNGKHYHAHKLQEWRAATGQTQEQVAHSIKKERRTILRAENGQQASYTLLCDLAKHYNRGLAELLVLEKV